MISSVDDLVEKGEVASAQSPHERNTR